MMLYKLLDIEHSRKVYELYIIFQGKMKVYYLYKKLLHSRIFKLQLRYQKENYLRHDQPL